MKKLASQLKTSLLPKDLGLLNDAAADAADVRVSNRVAQNAETRVQNGNVLSPQLPNNWARC